MVSRPLNLTTTPTVRITPTPTPTLGGVASRQRWPRPHVAANRLDLAPCAQRQAHGLRYSSHRRRPASAGRHTGRHTGRYTNHCTDQCRHLLPLGSGRLEPRGHSSMVDTNPALIAAAHAAARCFRAALGAPARHRWHLGAGCRREGAVALLCRFHCRWPSRYPRRAALGCLAERPPATLGLARAARP